MCVCVCVCVVRSELLITYYFNNFVVVRLFVAGLGKADLKFPDSAGGYAYAHSDQLDSTTRNRFIYWSVDLFIGLV